MHYYISVVNPENACLCDYTFRIEIKKFLVHALLLLIFFIGTYENNAFFVVEVGLDIITDAIKKFF